MSFDPGNPDNHDLVIQYVIAYMACEVCGSEYGLEDVQIIDAGADAWAMVAHCPHCGTEGLILAIASPLDDEIVESDPFFTNQWNPGLAPLTRHDVDEWRAFLADFHGDMHDLLGAGD
ncbi:MAG: hypothetical protein JXB47_05295 [Anaerolineae bacterium]|nr:hypothetical protein [Anaerolineae bacterium]